MRKSCGENTTTVKMFPGNDMENKSLGIQVLDMTEVSWVLILKRFCESF